MKFRPHPLAVLLTTVLAPTLSAQGAITWFGYAAVIDQGESHLAEVEAASIPINIAVVSFPEIWTQTDLASIIAEFQASNVKGVLSLENVLFKKFYVPSSLCQDQDGQFVYALRNNWQARLANFVSTNGHLISPQTVATLIVDQEVNNRCVSLGQVGEAAGAIKSYFPSLPVAMGYGRSPGAKPAPSYIPLEIDWIAFYKYGTFDPADPAHPYNADNQYLIEFNGLLSKLASHQRVFLVPDGFWTVAFHKTLNSHLGTGMGWPKWYLGSLAVNYEAFALGQSKVIGLMLFRWTSTAAYPEFVGTADLPAYVRDQHRAIVCRNLGC